MKKIGLPRLLMSRLWLLPALTKLALAAAGQVLHKDGQTYNVSIRPCHDVHDVLDHPRGDEVDVGLPLIDILTLVR
jgi:hypothetical protein